jgi:alpha-N-acetylgalactosaminidase
MTGHFKTDMETFASWGVDFLKLDGCYEGISDMKSQYPEVGKDLNATGRKIVYSCSWPAYLKFETVPWKDVQKNCNMWRLYDDIQDSWDSMIGIANFWGDKQAVLAPLAQPVRCIYSCRAKLHLTRSPSSRQQGAWNDPGSSCCSVLRC